MKKKTMKKPETPKFFADFYRDLRDKRLLIPIGALLVALIAVPMLLAKSPEAVEAPLVSALPEDASAVEAAVLAEQPGIRDYRKRLEALKEQNPFTQQFSRPTAESVAVTEPEDSSVDAAADTTSVSSTDVTVDTPGLEETIDTTTVTDSVPPVVEDTSGDGNDHKPHGPRFYEERIDVSMGPIGDGKTITNVASLDFLPGENSPVVSFVGLGKSGERAIFSVNPEVVDTSGDGNCSPKKASTCQYLSLPVGGERILEYAPNDTKYRLKLIDTRLVRVPDPRDG